MKCYFDAQNVYFSTPSPTPHDYSSKLLGFLIRESERVERLLRHVAKVRRGIACEVPPQRRLLREDVDELRLGEREKDWQRVRQRLRAHTTLDEAHPQRRRRPNAPGDQVAKHLHQEGREVGPCRPIAKHNHRE